MEIKTNEIKAAYIPNESIAERLYKLLSTILKDNSVIPAMYHSIILNLVRPYLQKASDSELREMIQKLRDEIIPWILNDPNIGE